VGEAVKAHQPVGLVQPVLAHCGRRGQRQGARGVGDGAEGRVVHPPQPVRAVQPRAGGEDGAVVRRIGPHDHLRALPARRKQRRAGPARGARLRHRHDGLRGLPLEEMENNLASMIKAAQARGAKVHLIGMKMPPNYGRSYTEKFSATGSWMFRQVGNIL
jgi:hypothetical protein